MNDQRWAAAVAALGMILRDSPYRGDVTFTLIRELAEKSRGQDEHAHRAEFLKLIEQARGLKQPTSDAK
ncbi:MAG: YfbK domain-containing protein [Gemmataceae bacterium]